MLLVNKQAVAAAFGRAAKSYARYDKLQQYSAQGLLDLLEKRNFITVLDAGCGPGSNSLFWREAGSRVVALDISAAMIVQARERQAADIYLIADIEALPLAESQFDLVWSHLAVQWCTSLSQALTNLYRVARPGGKIAFTTLLADSLCELNQAWRMVDNKQPHVNHFLTQQAVEDTLSSWRCRSRTQTITLYFSDAKSAMRSLKGIGATHIHDGRPRQLMTRRQLLCLEKSWPREAEYYSLTYQLFHGVIERD